ncbi:MAG: alpha/beta hydrolase [Pseudomonadota bacterium]
MATLTLILLLLGAVAVYANTRTPPPPIYHLFNALIGIVKPDFHTGRPSPCPRFTNLMRYPAVQPPKSTANQHGEIETLDDGTECIHWYAVSDDITWHFVTAGDPADPAVLMLHGLPESWWAFHHQIAELAKDHYVIALDCKGYGQSDKRLELDYRTSSMARETANLLDQLGVDRFSIVAHDRGAIIADHMAAVESLQGRIIRYVRMQQSFNEPHGEPKPPHAMFATRVGVGNFQSKNLMNTIYNKVMVSNLSQSTLKRLDYEFKFEGVAEAVSRYFQTTNFDIEMQERQAGLFKALTMPTLILQGKYDAGQHPEEYARSHEFADDLRVAFVEGNHFSHLENPRAINSAIRAFFAETAAA